MSIALSDSFYHSEKWPSLVLIKHLGSPLHRKSYLANFTFASKIGFLWSSRKEEIFSISLALVRTYSWELWLMPYRFHPWGLSFLISASLFLCFGATAQIRAMKLFEKGPFFPIALRHSSTPIFWNPCRSISLFPPSCLTATCRLKQENRRKASLGFKSTTSQSPEGYKKAS